MSVNDWIFYPRADYIAQSWRKRSPLTPRRRQPAANNMRELNFRSHLPQHYFCSRLLLLDLLLSDQKENDAWNPLLLCSSSFRVTRRKPHNAKMRIAYKIFASDICMDTATRDNWRFFLLSVSTQSVLTHSELFCKLYSHATLAIPHFDHIFVYYRCRFFAQFYPWVPVVHGIVTFFVIANFTLATFMDPGVIPKGKYSTIFCHM